MRGRTLQLWLNVLCNRKQQRSARQNTVGYQYREVHCCKLSAVKTKVLHYYEHCCQGLIYVFKYASYVALNVSHGRWSYETKHNVTKQGTGSLLCDI